MANPEERLAIAPEAEMRSSTGLLGSDFRQQGDRERLQRHRVEFPGSFDVADDKTNMIDHSTLLHQPVGMRGSKVLLAAGGGNWQPPTLRDKHKHYRFTVI